MSLRMPDLRAQSHGPHVIRYKRLRCGSFFADFRRDKRLYPEVYHCLIQREDSAQILAWTQHRSLEDAIASAQEEIRRIAGVDSVRVEGQA